jgi:transposase
MGMVPETLRRWVRQAQIDDADRSGTPTTMAEQNRELQRRNAELEQTVEILKAATSFFARECDPRPKSSAGSSTPIRPGSGSHRSAVR